MNVIGGFQQLNKWMFKLLFLMGEKSVCKFCSILTLFLNKIKLYTPWDF